MDGVGTPIIGRPRPLPGHDTPNPAYHPHTLNYEEPEKLGFDRLCTVTRMIKEYSEGNLTLDELTRLAVNYRFGLTDIPTTLVGDVAPGPAEGEVSEEIGRGVSRKQLTYEEYDHILLARMARIS